MLTGCSMTPLDTRSNIVPPALHDFPSRWITHGRISIINDKENWYAKFIWQQQGDDFQLSFMGPLGETELQLTRKDEKNYLKTPSYERSSFELEHLLFEETGWKLPVNSLRYWSYGSPDPDVLTKILYDKQGNISDLFHNEWHIQYAKRVLVGQYFLPKKIIVTKQSVKIKIIITQWDIDVPETSLK